jgi:tetraacyldisaccharide 4'-kinase
VSWPEFWQHKSWQSTLLAPLSRWVCFVAQRRLNRFKKADFASPKGCCVVVVGNVVVGGSGKTPFIAWLVRGLSAKGFKVGIISRGYGAKNSKWPQYIDPKALNHSHSKANQLDSKSFSLEQNQFAESRLKESRPNACQFGDEPLMLAQKTKVPVGISPKRIQALNLLLEKQALDVIISDDGLQHYGLPRDIEVVMVDNDRLFGNQMCMPSGPLREPMNRVNQVDFIVWNGLQSEMNFPLIKTVDYGKNNHFKMALKPVCFKQVGQPEIEISVDEFCSRYQSVNAIAGIGNPNRFFKTLTDLGLEVSSKAFADHYSFDESSLSPFQVQEADNSELLEKVLVMTEKDAVKCQQFAINQPHWWYLEVESVCSQKLLDQICSKVNSVNNKNR